MNSHSDHTTSQNQLKGRKGDKVDDGDERFNEYKKRKCGSRFSKNNNSEENVLCISTLGKRGRPSIVLSPTNNVDLLLYNKWEEANIIEDNEVTKVDVDNYFNTVVHKVIERNTKIGEVIDIPKEALGTDVKDTADIIEDEEETKVDVVERLRITNSR